MRRGRPGAAARGTCAHPTRAPHVRPPCGRSQPRYPATRSGIGWHTACMERPPSCPRPVETLPKAHLHLHFTGSMRPSTLKELAAKHGIRLPESLREHHLLRLTPDERGWFRFQRLYDAARACVRDAEDMRRIVLEAAEDDAAEGSG